SVGERALRVGAGRFGDGVAYEQDLHAGCAAVRGVLPQAGGGVPRARRRIKLRSIPSDLRGRVRSHRRRAYPTGRCHGCPRSAGPARSLAVPEPGTVSAGVQRPR
ncbi:MAG: hypothetical protein ACK56I_22935, partial [bacterium]